MFDGYFWGIGELCWFVVFIGAILSTLIILKELFIGANSSFTLQITFWLWVTILFANFAEALAEGRGKARANKHEIMMVPDIFFEIFRKKF